MNYHIIYSKGVRATDSLNCIQTIVLKNMLETLSYEYHRREEPTREALDLGPGQWKYPGSTKNSF